jgi:hypothetical protein
MTLTAAVLLDRFLAAALCHERLLAANWNRQFFWCFWNLGMYSILMLGFGNMIQPFRAQI